MKRIFTILSAVLITTILWAQVPEKISYQAVVRDANNSLVTSQTIGMQISILAGSTSGAAVFVETHDPMSNTNGLVTLEIGTGTIISGDFSAIDWSATTYFIKTETDPAGGANYTISGTSQLMSVPYALHAKTADSISGGINFIETDPLFKESLAFGITASDTAFWNSHTINTDTQLDSMDMAELGYVAGAHFKDIDTTGAYISKINNGAHSFFDLSVTNELYNAATKQQAIVGVSKDNHNPIDTNDTRAFMVHTDELRNLTKSVVCEPGELTISVQNDSLAAANKDPFQAVIQMNDASKRILIGNAYDSPEKKNAIVMMPDFTALYYSPDDDATSRALSFSDGGLRMEKNDIEKFRVDMDGTTTIGEVLNITPRSTAPANPSKGTVYFNSTSNKLMVYDGTVWQACW
jgi:hypothetical protein